MQSHRTVPFKKSNVHETVNVLFGPPSDLSDCKRMMHLFFSEQGAHIICGGTTASIAAEYLKKPLRTSLHYVQDDIPPIAYIEGVDLVTEGVVTMGKVLEYAKAYSGNTQLKPEQSAEQDAATMVFRLLFENASQINLYIGRAVNPAHQYPDSPINFKHKMQLVKDLIQCLTQAGKLVKANYF